MSERVSGVWKQEQKNVPCRASNVHWTQKSIQDSKRLILKDCIQYNRQKDFFGESETRTPFFCVLHVADISIQLKMPAHTSLKNEVKKGAYFQIAAK